MSEFIQVPGTAPRRECDGCKATVYFVGAVPVHCDVEGGIRPHRIAEVLGGTRKVGGRGVDHRTNCPHVAPAPRAR